MCFLIKFKIKRHFNSIKTKLITISNELISKRWLLREWNDFHDRHPHNIVVGKCSKLCWSQSRLTLQPFQRAFGAVFGYRQGFVMTASYRIEKKLWWILAWRNFVSTKVLNTTANWSWNKGLCIDEIFETWQEWQHLVSK